jgi:hypothetical protein
LTGEGEGYVVSYFGVGELLPSFCLLYVRAMLHILEIVPSKPKRKQDGLGTTTFSDTDTAASVFKILGRDPNLVGPEEVKMVRGFVEGIVYGMSYVVCIVTLQILIN